MCLTIPGKVIEINENEFVIEYPTEKRTVNNSIVNVSIGDYVIVSNKIIIDMILKERVDKFYEMIKDVRK